MIMKNFIIKTLIVIMQWEVGDKLAEGCVDAMYCREVVNAKTCVNLYWEY
jgi:16S rRNA A1518/A1519 N6-dimethyltransferase RsmA/KsgA/DIM1 with predicted DNA glycosylase/AP lyase activity